MMKFCECCGKKNEYSKEGKFCTFCGEQNLKNLPQGQQVIKKQRGRGGPTYHTTEPIK